MLRSYCVAGIDEDIAALSPEILQFFLFVFFVLFYLPNPWGAINSQRVASRPRVLTGNQALQPTIGQNSDTTLFFNHMDQTGGIGERGVDLKDTFI